jgi:hypothetical protein
MFHEKTFDEKKHIDCTYSISGIIIQFHENRLAVNILFSFITVYPYLNYFAIIHSMTHCCPTCLNKKGGLPLLVPKKANSPPFTPPPPPTCRSASGSGWRPSWLCLKAVGKGGPGR